MIIFETLTLHNGAGCVVGAVVLSCFAGVAAAAACCTCFLIASGCIFVPFLGQRACPCSWEAGLGFDVSVLVLIHVTPPYIGGVGPVICAFAWSGTAGFDALESYTFIELKDTLL